MLSARRARCRSARDKRLVGIISLGDLMEDGDHPRRAGNVLADVSRPGGVHFQAGDARH